MNKNKKKIILQRIWLELKLSYNLPSLSASVD